MYTTGNLTTSKVGGFVTENGVLPDKKLRMYNAKQLACN
jgi:hypothetical protein